MTLEQLLNLLGWFDLNGGTYPFIKTPSSKTIEILQNDLAAAEINLELLTKTNLFLNKYLLKTESLNIYIASLLWLIDAYNATPNNRMQQLKFQQKIGITFSIFLDLMPDLAIAFYKQETSLNKIYPAGIHLISGRETKQKSKDSQLELKLLIQEKTEKLNEVKQPLSLLLHINYANNLDFAAYIIWLLNKGISAETILVSGVLQAFFMFNLYQLDEEDNPIQNFYNILANFDVAQRLLTLSYTIGVGNETFIKYNLQGQICSQEQLITVQIVKPAFIGILDETLFQKLYSLFEIEFLYSTVNHYYETDENKTILIQVLNKNGEAFSALPELVKTIRSSQAQHGQLLHLKSLAHLIAKQSLLQHLVTNNEWIMLYLLPFNKIESVLTKQEFISYIKEFIDNKNISLYDKFDLLLILQNWTKNKGCLECSHFLYQQTITLALFTPNSINEENQIMEYICDEYLELVEDNNLDDAVDDNPGCSDYESTTEESSSFSQSCSYDSSGSDSNLSGEDDENYRIETLECIEALRLDYKAQWNDLCKEILSKSVFSCSDYKVLQENWNIYIQKKNLFQRLRAMPEREEACLNELLITKAFKLQGNAFNLTDLIAILFDLSDNKAFFNCHKTLVAVLLKSEDALLTMQVIKLLAEANRFWYLIPWRKGKSIFTEAVSYGHVPLTIYLLEQFSIIPFEQEYLHSTFLLAIENKNLAICNLFLNPNVICQFNENQLSLLFIQALEDQKIFVRFIQNKQLLCLTENTYFALIYKAAENGYVWALSCLCDPGIGFKPKVAIFNKALSKATKNKQWEFIEKLCALENEMAPCEKGLSHAWEIASDFLEEEQLHFLDRSCKQFSSKFASECLVFLLKSNHYFSLDFIINWTKKYQLSTKELESLQTDVAKVILDDIIPNSRFKMLDYIYQQFREELQPDVKTVQEGVKLVFINKSKDTFKVLYKYAINHFDNEMLLTSLSLAMLEEHKFVRYLKVVILKKGVTKATDLSKEILNHTKPKARPKILHYIYTKFQPELQPDATTVEQCFKLALINKDQETMQVLCGHACEHLPNEILISSLVAERRERDSIIALTLENAIRSKIISPTQFSNLILAFVNSNDFISISIIKELYNQTSERIEELVEAIYISAKAGFYQSFIALLQASQHVNNDKNLRPKVLEIALANHQAQFIADFCKSDYLTLDDKKQFIPVLIKANKYTLLARLCNGDENQAKELWNCAFNQAVQLNNAAALSYICHPSRFSQRWDWNSQLLKATAQGKLDQIKVLVIAATSKSCFIEIDKLKQIAQREGQPTVVAWFDHIKALNAYNRVAPAENLVLTRAYKILSDYTKSGSALTRFFSGHWNRHYIKEIDDLLAAFPDSMDKLLADLRKIKILNPHGSLARRITYISEFLLPLAEESLSAGFNEDNRLNII
jgi:uncharacterized protein YxeA